MLNYNSFSNNIVFFKWVESVETTLCRCRVIYNAFPITIFSVLSKYLTPFKGLEFFICGSLRFGIGIYGWHFIKVFQITPDAFDISLLSINVNIWFIKVRISKGHVYYVCIIIIIKMLLFQFPSKPFLCSLPLVTRARLYHCHWLLGHVFMYMLIN